MEFLSKHKTAIILTGAVVAVAVAGKIANDRNGWWDNMFKKKEDEKEEEEKIEPLPVERPANSQPRGKLPWSIGDVGLWDDENPKYCAECAAVCDQSYSGKNSTQCEMCLADCA